MITTEIRRFKLCGHILLLLMCFAAPGLATPVPTDIVISSQDVDIVEPIVLTDEFNTISLSKGLKIQSDGSGNMTIDEAVMHLDTGAFRPLEGHAINEGFGTNAVFAYAVVENRTVESQWFLHLNYALLDSIEVYIVQDFGASPKPLIYMGQDGDTLPFEQRKIKVPGFVFPVTVPAGQKAFILVKIQTQGARYAELSLRTAAGLASGESSSALGLGLYFGGMIVFSIYTLLLFLLMRSSSYLIFFGLVSMMTLFFVAEAGLVSQYISASDPIWANLLFLLALSGITFTGLWLNLSFLRKTLSSREQRLIKWLMGCAGVNFILSFGLSYAIVSRIGLGLIAVFMTTTCWLAVRAWLAGYLPAKKFSYAIFVMIIGGSIESLKVLGYIPINDVSRFGPSAGVAGFIFLMSVALIERMILKQDKAKALFRSFEKFAPASLVRALHENGEVVGIGGSRRHVTILFSDIKGYSSVVESTDPQIVVQLMTEYFDNMQRSIEKHGGYILEFAGDGILAVFGAPTSLENHPEAATKSAIEMHRIVAQLNRSYAESGRLEVFQDVGLDALSIRIGVHTGSVIAGTLGSRQTLKYGIPGDAVNVAARLEALNKELGSVLLISHATFETMSHEVQGSFEGLGPYPVKGRQEPVEIFRLVEEHLDQDASVKLESINSFDWWEQSMD